MLQQQGNVNITNWYYTGMIMVDEFIMSLSLLHHIPSGISDLPAFSALCRSSLLTSPCCGEHSCLDFSGKPSSSGPSADQQSQTAGKCRKWSRGNQDSASSDAPHISCKCPLDIHSGTHNQSMSWCLVVGWAAPAKLCETLWLLWRRNLRWMKKRGLTQLNWFNYNKIVNQYYLGKKNSQ